MLKGLTSCQTYDYDHTIDHHFWCPGTFAL